MGFGPLRLRNSLLLAALPLVCAATIPPDVETMLRTAKPAERATVASVAKRAAPDSAAEIDALIADLNRTAEISPPQPVYIQLAKVEAPKKKAEAAEKSDAPGFFSGWKGEGSLGGNYSTGNVDQVGFSSALKLNKRGEDWEQALNLSFDYLRNNGLTQRERVYASYQARRDLGTDWFFAFGLLSFERDRFAGISRRFTESAGLGYRLSDAKDFKLTVEGGPALRQTDFTDGRNLEKADLLGRTDLSWKVSDAVRITQAAGFVLSTENSSFYSRSALTTSIIDNLSFRTSFDLTHESDPPLGREGTDTISRASLVYGF